MSGSKRASLPWEPEDDQYVRTAVQQQGRRWTEIGTLIGRTGKQVRERFLNTLDPSISNQPWTLAEDRKLYSAVRQYGNKFVFIKQELFPHRGESDVKNRYHNAIFRSNTQNLVLASQIELVSLLTYAPPLNSDTRADCGNIDPNMPSALQVQTSRATSNFGDITTASSDKESGKFGTDDLQLLVEAMDTVLGLTPLSLPDSSCETPATGDSAKWFI